MAKNGYLLASKIFAVTFSFIYSLVGVGSSIAFENADTISSFLDQNYSNIVTDHTSNSDEVDTEYFKSDYSSVKEVKEKSVYYSQKMMEEGAVLLKNNACLPMNKGTKVSLFSASSVDPVYTGARETKEKYTDYSTYG